MTLRAELHEGVSAEVGGIPVRRVLPRRKLRTVGAWCFADHMGPVEVSEHTGLDVGPHPHTGLQTVTWLLDGAVLHKDSIGSEQLIRPGQLNLMSAGRGVVHAEEASRTYRGSLQGVQLWVAQDEVARHGEAAFEHVSELPQLDLGQGSALLLAGSLLGTDSPARFASELFGAHLQVAGSITLPLRPDHEYALIALDGVIEVAGMQARPGQLAELGLGRDEIELTSASLVNALLIGGKPFTEPLFMWWNFVGRSASEVRGFVRDWRERNARFGEVNSELERIPAPPAPWEPALVKPATEGEPNS